MARGHLRKRSKDAWSIVIELDRDPDTGKRRQKWSTVHGPKRDAEKELTRLLTEADKGQLHAATHTTLSAYLERWLAEYVAPNLAPSTRVRSSNLAHNYLIPQLGKLDLEAIRPAHITRMLTALRSAPHPHRPNRTLAAGTLRYIYNVLHSALDHAVEAQLIPVNPTLHVQPPKLTHTEMRAFDPAQARAFLAASQEAEVRWQAFFTLALTTGMRRGELLGLRWSDLHLHARTLTIQQTIYRLHDQGLVIKPPKTAASRRTVALGVDVVALLRQQRIHQNEQRLAAGSTWQDYNLVFTTPVGAPLEVYAVRTTFKRICEAAGVPVIRIHDLRHTAATLLLTAGINPKVVSERLGHSSVSITLQVYSHTGRTLQEQAADTLTTLLTEPENALANG